jgi:peptidoglycan/xylan/chitin deacetylase (PgdA/CDA1 family)
MSMQTVRACLAAVSHTVGLLRWFEQHHRESLTVLTYHRVLPQERRQRYPLPDLVVTPETFRQHCRILGHHFEMLTLAQAFAAWSTGRRTDRPIAAMTFDDGYRDNAEYAAPILAETGLPATFFVIAGLVGTEASPWYDRLGRALAFLIREQRLTPDIIALLGGNPDEVPGRADVRRLVGQAKLQPPAERRNTLAQIEQTTGGAHLDAQLDDDRIMSFDTLRQLVAAGHEIGSHSDTHEILPLLDSPTLEQEVAGSRRRLEKHLGVRVQSFCYPNGDVDRRVARAVTEAGYTCATSTIAGVNSAGQDAYHLRRRFMHEERLAGYRGQTSAPLVRAELCGLADHMFLRNWRQVEKA